MPDTPNSVSHVVTGPRTVAGKRRSSLNAITHGLFSEGQVLVCERPILEKLHKKLRECLKPQDIVQDLTVHEIAVLYVHERRKNLYETAVIARSTTFVGIDGLNSDLPRPALLRGHPKDGTTILSAKVVLLQMVMEKLDQLSKNIADGEFDPEKVQIILFEIYGAFDPRSDQGFCGKFFALMQVSKSCDTVDSEAISKRAQELINVEMRRLSELVKKVESDDVVFNSLATLLPPQAELDRIIRCGSHLTREIERKINLLRQLQRESGGYPPSPTIKLDLG